MEVIGRFEAAYPKAEDVVGTVFGDVFKEGFEFDFGVVVYVGRKGFLFFVDGGYFAYVKDGPFLLGEDAFGRESVFRDGEGHSDEGDNGEEAEWPELPAGAYPD